ncbi:MAG TPA: LarC family nickel insertion protein [Phycisphaeraceae bacterium]
MPVHLHLDPFSGVAGDMFLGALIDLGAPLEALSRSLAHLPLQKPYRITAEKVSRCGITATDLKVHVGEPPHHPRHGHGHSHEHAHNHSHDHSHSHDHHHDHDHDHKHDHHHDHDHHHSHTHKPDQHSHAHSHEHTGYRDIMAMIDQLETAERAKERARRVVTLLAQAEAHIHGTSVDQVHFHEVGAVDSIVDMLGAAVALELLGVETLSCGPLPISRGMVRCAHGLMPVPAPAALHLLRGLPVVGVDRVGELVTPTGAALVAGLCEAFGPPPMMTVQAVGYGAGDRDDPQVPNLLRVVLGQRLTPAQASSGSSASAADAQQAPPTLAQAPASAAFS